MTSKTAIAVLVVVGLTAAGTAAVLLRKPDPPPTIALQPCEVANVSAQCGTLEVFEDRGSRRGRKIGIKVVVLRALGQATAEPIFWLEGGPGGAATSAIGPVSQQYLRDLRDSRDLVFVDQRGTGGSNPLNCTDIGESPDNLDAFFGRLFPPHLIRACRQQLEQNADLRQYTTPLAMDDMDDVRAALGYEHINLAGASYGTLSAQIYIKRHPGRVRAAFLVGLATTSFKLPLPFARATQNAWDRVVTDCAADAPCRGAFPELKAEFDAVLARFADGPIQVQMRDPATGRDRSVALEREAFVERLRAMLYTTFGARVVPIVVHRAFLGDFHAFQTMAARHRLGGASSRGAYFSMTCSESVPFITEAEIVAETSATFLGDRRTRAHIDACKEWVRGDVDRSFLEPVRTDVSVVLFSGDVDGATPPWIADQAIANFSNGRLVRAINTGHQVSGPCTWGLMHAFFTSPVARQLDVSCAADLRRPAFALEVN